jgi:sulfatase maturation enzyme AslB (radical SAM superfamily)
MRITNSGGYEYCRWANTLPTGNISTSTPVEFFQQGMQSVRQEFIEGNSPAGCQTCHNMEQHNKISGRQKQLLKIGVQLDKFEKSLASSPWVTELSKSSTTQLPQDWQIDLGNFCNSACIFCSPKFSSRLASEWKKIGFIDNAPLPNWSDDPALVQQFVDSLKQSPHIQYLHFIGGETLITPAFKIILKALVDAGLHKTATIGFTTNLSVWRDDIVELLTQFESVHLGLSIESFSIINDYVRWPVCLPTVFENLERWHNVADQNQWLLQLRTTPSCLTVHKLLPIYDYALTHNIIVESCNFLHSPEVMKPSVLPMSYRQTIINNMQSWIDKHTLTSDTIVNIRNPGTVQAQLVQDLSSYVNYLKTEPDESDRLPELVTWLKRIEANRGNSILTYLPEYEELFRSAGY